jgi:hypothetical protein
MASATASVVADEKRKAEDKNKKQTNKQTKSIEVNYIELNPTNRWKWTVTKRNNTVVGCHT